MADSIAAIAAEMHAIHDHYSTAKIAGWAMRLDRLDAEMRKTAPPNDASGGVTEPLNELLMDAIDSLDEGGFKDVANRLHAQFDRIVAADRARKPGYRQVTLSDVGYLAQLTQTNPNGLLAEFQRMGAVIPDAGRGEK